MKRSLLSLALFAATLGCDVPAIAFAVHDGPGSATCAWLDSATGLRWKRPRGDWFDANGVSWGEDPYSETEVRDLDREQAISWDVTRLVREWRNGVVTNQGFLLRVPSGRSDGRVEFQSRESRAQGSRPRLEITFADGYAVDAEPVADTQLDCSTYRPLGGRASFAVDRGVNALVRFDLEVGDREVRSAALRLTTTDRQFGSTRVGIFRVAGPMDPMALPGASPRVQEVPPQGPGLVLLVEDFEENGWAKNWSSVHPRSTIMVVADDPNLGFSRHRGKALRVRIPKGSQLGLDMRYRFGNAGEREPDEAWFRYYLRLGSDFLPTIDGGKLPGFAGTYERAGWGGRRSDGHNGWSARGGFGIAVPVGHPLAGNVPVHSYVYHSDMKEATGETWPWSTDRPGVLAQERWYCIEQHVRLNAPGASDGVLQAWIDGHIALDRRDVRFRESMDLHIETVWFNVFHGGTSASPLDQHLYIDSIVIATRPIGCI